MSRKRRSYEAGHKAKYLVIIDDTPECDRAMYYASRRAARVGVSVVLLRVIENRDHGQQWLGVADIMRAEAHEEANARLATFAARSNGIAGITPECVIREGEWCSPQRWTKRGRDRWSPISAAPPAPFRFRWRSCLGI